MRGRQSSRIPFDIDRLPVYNFYCMNELTDSFFSFQSINGKYIIHQLFSAFLYLYVVTLGFLLLFLLKSEFQLGAFFFYTFTGFFQVVSGYKVILICFYLFLKLLIKLF